MKVNRNHIKSETLPKRKRWSKRATLRDVIVMQRYNYLNANLIKRSQFPNSIILSDGFELKKPIEWQ